MEQEFRPFSGGTLADNGSLEFLGYKRIDNGEAEPGSAPVPPRFRLVVKKGLKTRDLTASDIPFPLSLKSISK